MAPAARLERLQKLIQADLDVLPDRTPEPIVSSSDVSSDVSLQHTAGVVNKPTATNLAQRQTKPVSVKPTTEEPNTGCRYVWLKDAKSSHIPASNTKSITPSPKPTARLPATKLNRGDLAPPAQHYTPILALAKYPYKWCDKADSQDIASAFFDRGKFWAREWDLYYVWDIDNHSKPLVLVCDSQFQFLLREINDHLKLDLRVTDQQREDALVGCFPDHPRCTPRYLGRSESREDYDNMIENAPDHGFHAVGEPESPPLDERTLEAFKQLMEEFFEAQKAKNKATKAKKQQDRLLKQKSMADQFKRAQRYLGLRPSPVAGSPTPIGQPPAINPTLSAPFDFDQSVVFVCVDIESYERAHHKITEIGVATLDTRELMSIPPGPDGENWRRLIRARHFRIKENAHLVNSKFVQGHPEGFDFGESTLIPLVEAPAHVAACFKPPFGAHYSNGAESLLDPMKGVNLNEKRNIIFLGHDTQGDVRYLQNLGYDPLKTENLLEALDTAAMYRVWRREHNPASLGRILYDFDIAGYKLHNAGNDAVFTVQAMLGICVREASIRGSPELDNMRSSEKSARLAIALEEAQQKASDEADGWSDRELDGDGGAPVPLAVSTPKPASTHTTSQLSDSTDRGAFRGRGRGRSRGRSRGRGGFHDTMYRSHEPSDGYSNSSGRGRGRSERGQPGGLRTQGTRSMMPEPLHKVESQFREANLPSRGRGSYRGRGGSSNSENTTPGPQARYYW